MPVNMSSFVRAQVVFTEPTGDAPRTWDANLEFAVVDGLTDSVRAISLAENTALFFQRLLMPPYRIDHVVIDDGLYEGPYNPEKVLVRPVNLVGTRPEHTTVPVETADLLGLSDVLKIRKEVDSGYPGRLDLRGFLTEEDVDSAPTTGARRLTDVVGLQGEVDDAWQTYTEALDLLEVSVAMYGEGAGEFDNRRVNGVTVTKAGVRQLKNNVAPRYPSGPFGQIIRAIETVSDNLDALQAIAELLNSLGWLGQIVLSGAVASKAQTRKRRSSRQGR